MYILNEFPHKVNIKKSSYILFKCKQHMSGHEIFLDGRKLSLVELCVYLVVNLTENMSINEETESVTSIFLRPFYVIYSNFYRSQSPGL